MEEARSKVGFCFFRIFEFNSMGKIVKSWEWESSKLINENSKYVYVYCDESEFSHFRSEMFLGKLCECTL